jgi:hypothetical protein
MQAVGRILNLSQEISPTFCLAITTLSVKEMVMDIPDVRDPAVQTTVQTWLNETGELFVELYYPRSGGSGWSYLLTSPPDLNHLVEQARDGGYFFLLRQQQFPLRGIVDDVFVRQVIATIRDGDDYLITDLAVYPQHVSFYGDGQTHKQLLADLHELRGVMVGVGREPDTNPAYWKQDVREDRLTAIKRPVERRQ